MMEHDKPTKTEVLREKALDALFAILNKAIVPILEPIIRAHQRSEREHLRQFLREIPKDDDRD